MHDSLANPSIAERQPNGDLLVQYRINDHRVGYLVATQTKDLIAVRTFLFLTMQRTPEGKALEKRLGLTREEIDYLGLHEMARFMQTDLKDDAQLRRMLEQCGCGHLFELAEENGAPLASGIFPPPKPFAAELRQYLGMKESTAAEGSPARAEVSPARAEVSPARAEGPPARAEGSHSPLAA